MKSTEDTQTQLLIFLATKIMRMETWMQYMKARTLINREGVDPEVLSTFDKLYSSKTASDQFEAELDSFSIQFSDCELFAREYADLTRQNHAEALDKAVLRLDEKPNA